MGLDKLWKYLKEYIHPRKREHYTQERKSNMQIGCYPENERPDILKIDTEHPHIKLSIGRKKR